MSQKAFELVEKEIRELQIRRGSNLLLMKLLILQLDMQKAWMESETKDGSDSFLRQECMKRIEKEEKEKGFL